MNRWFALSEFRVSLLVTSIILLLYLGTAQFTPMRNLETTMLNLRFQLRGVKTPGNQIVMVLIDEKSIAALGRWPWSRITFAEIVQRLSAAGAKVIAFDLLFLEPESPAVLEALRQLQALWDSTGFSTIADPKLARFQQTLQELARKSDPDYRFATALQEAGNVLLPLSFVVDQTQGSASSFSLLSPGAERRGVRSTPHFVTRSAYRSMHPGKQQLPVLPLVATDLLSPLEKLGEQAKAVAHVNVAFDTDGTPRYDYPVVEYQGAYYPSLAIQVARLYQELTLEEVSIRFGKGIRLGETFIPTDESMRMLVNYYGPPGTFSRFSFVDVLHGAFPSSTFEDKIVLIGGEAVGVSDTFVTPFSPVLSGVERHATVIETILQRDFLLRRDSTQLLDLLCIGLLGGLLGWLSPKFPSFWGHLCAFGLAGFYGWVNFILFTRAGLWVNLSFPILTVLFTQGAITLYKFLVEERQKRMIRRAFQHYLHPAVVEQVSQNPQSLTLGGEEKELTVLFSDIRGFSTISEQLTPQELVHLLNEYLTAMTRIVLENQGLLDKYIGDAIMAVYGAPLPLPDHAYRACHTAIHMLTTLYTLQQEWKRQGLPPINIGVGINTGRMVVGNMGSDLRFDYTVMGDEVNLGSRLEGVNKEYGTQIIISESTWTLVRDRIATRELDLIRVKGKEHPTRIFEVVGFLPLPSGQMERVKRFEEGLYAYREQQWDQAIRCFDQVLHQTPQDRPSQLYLQRCQEFRTHPPPANWDGVYVLKTK